MAEHTQTGDGPEQSVTPAETQPEAPPPDTDHFVPRGAFYFALVMIIGYIIYFFLTYYEVVLLRGGA